MQKISVQQSYFTVIFLRQRFIEQLDANSPMMNFEITNGEQSELPIPDNLYGLIQIMDWIYFSGTDVLQIFNTFCNQMLESTNADRINDFGQRDAEEYMNNVMKLIRFFVMCLMHFSNLEFFD